MPFQLVTSRLLLRPWQDRDREPFAAMNADPIVMHFFAAPLTRVESDASIDRYLAQFERDGFTLFAAETKQTGAFVGMIGMQFLRDTIPNLPQPAVEIGWRLVTSAQGQGLATEGASAMVHFAFQTIGLQQLVAITAIPNQPSRRVMEKLGMTHRPELDFDHPRVPAGHPYRRHPLYSLHNPNMIEAHAPHLRRPHLRQARHPHPHRSSCETRGSTTLRITTQLLTKEHP